MLTTDDLHSVEKLIAKVVKASEKRLISLVVKNQNAIIAHFENEDTKLEKRVERIENKLGMSSVN